MAVRPNWPSSSLFCWFRTRQKLAKVTQLMGNGVRVPAGPSPCMGRALQLPGHVTQHCIWLSAQPWEWGKSTPSSRAGGRSTHWHRVTGWNSISPLWLGPAKTFKDSKACSLRPPSGTSLPSSICRPLAALLFDNEMKWRRAMKEDGRREGGRGEPLSPQEPSACDRCLWF
jgi:hypothetical protein